MLRFLPQLRNPLTGGLLLTILCSTVAPRQAVAQPSALQTGDILVARGVSIVPGYFKHVAIYEGNGCVIEGMPGGVRRTPIAQFWGAWPTIQVGELGGMSRHGNDFPNQKTVALHLRICKKHPCRSCADEVACDTMKCVVSSPTDYLGGRTGIDRVR